MTLIVNQRINQWLSAQRLRLIDADEQGLLRGCRKNSACLKDFDSLVARAQIVLLDLIELVDRARSEGSGEKQTPYGKDFLSKPERLNQTIRWIQEYKPFVQRVTDETMENDDETSLAAEEADEARACFLDRDPVDCKLILLDAKTQYRFIVPDDDSDQFMAHCVMDTLLISLADRFLKQHPDFEHMGRQKFLDIFASRAKPVSIGIPPDQGRLFDR